MSRHKTRKQKEPAYLRLESSVNQAAYLLGLMAGALEVKKTNSRKKKKMAFGLRTLFEEMQLELLRDYRDMHDEWRAAHLAQNN